MKDLIQLGVSVFFISKLLKSEKNARYGNPKNSCPKATVDLKTNTKNRNASIRSSWIQYGPLNLSDNAYWKRLAKHWNTSEKVARNSRCANCVAFDISPRMLDCIKAGPVSDQGEDGAGILACCGGRTKYSGELAACPSSRTDP